MSNIILDNITYNQPVADTVALNAIPTGSLVAGVQCFVNSPPSMYYWSGSAWVLTAGGGANSDGSYLVQTATDAPVNAQVMAVLATGLVKNTTSTGVQSIGVDGTDYYGPATTTISQNVGDFNLYVGDGTGSATAGTDNVGFGPGTGASITTSTDNTMVGFNAGNAIVDASFNTAVGSGALSAVNYAHNAAFGYMAANKITGNYNAAFGANTFVNCDAGSGLNTAVGGNAASARSNYIESTFVGYFADALSAGLENCGAFGANANIAISNAINLGNSCYIGISQSTPLGTLHISNVSSNCSLILDVSAGLPSVISGSGLIYAYNGGEDLHYIGGGTSEDYVLNATYQLVNKFNSNVFIGTQTGHVGNITLSGQRNTGLGSSSFQQLTTGQDNVGIGVNTANVATTASRNITIGTDVGNQNIAGSDNVSIGFNASFAPTDYSGTVAIGRQAGASQAAYTNCVFLGYECDSSVNNLNNSVAIGYQATVTADNSFILGNGCKVGIGVTQPLGSLHVDNVGNVANLVFGSSTDVPGAIGGANQLYSVDPDLFYINSSGLIKPLNQILNKVVLLGIDYTKINAIVDIIPPNSVNNIAIYKITLYTTTAIAGGDLIFQTSTPDTIMTFSAASLVTGSVVNETMGVAGTAYFTNITNLDIQLVASGTLSAGVVNILIEYEFT